MSIAPITQEQRKCVKDEIDMDDAQAENKVRQIKEWMSKQPHLPQLPDGTAEKVITNFLVGTKMSTEITKTKLDGSFAIRHLLSEVYGNFDPIQQEVRDSVDKIRYFPLSELTPDALRVTVVSYNPEKKASSKDTYGFYKRVMAITAARLAMGEFCRGEVCIVDSKGFHKSYITEMPWAFIYKFTSLAQESLPIRYKGIYIINAPPFAEVVLNMVKPALKEKVRNRVHVFQGDHTNLYKFIPQDILPSDFGGKAPSVEESSRAWQNTIESMRDLLVEESKRKTDESKRPADCPSHCGQMFGVNGTFNKLNID